MNFVAFYIVVYCKGVASVFCLCNMHDESNWSLNFENYNSEIYKATNMIQTHCTGADFKFTVYTVILKMNGIYAVHSVTNALFVYSWSHTQVTILASLYAAAAVILTEFICVGH
jgi:hypothetical protein